MPPCRPASNARSSGVSRASLLLTLAGLLAACQPTVRVEAPREPITINLNVRIEHEVRVRIEREVERVLETRDDIF